MASIRERVKTGLIPRKRSFLVGSVAYTWWTFGMLVGQLIPEGATDETVEWMMLARTLVAACVLLSLRWLDKRLVDLVMLGRHAFCAWSAAGALGTALLVLARSSDLALPLLAIAAILQGIAQVAFFLYWSARISVFRLEQFCTVVLFSSMVGSALAWSCVMAPYPVNATLYCLLPLVQLALPNGHGEPIAASRKWPLCKPTEQPAKVREYPGSYLPIPIVHGVCYGALYGLSTDSSHAVSALCFSMLAWTTIMLALGCAMSVAFFWRFQYRIVHRPVIALFVPAFALVPGVLSSEPAALAALGAAGLAVFLVVLWESSCDITNMFRYDLATTMALRQGSGIIGLTAGAVAVCLLGGASLALEMRIVCSGVLLVILFSSSLMFIEDQAAIEDRLSAPFDEASSAASIEQTCEFLATRYGLSPREVEILTLMGKGRDTRRIEEMLVISYDTVRTHARNIYKKLRVHSRQEVIDLIEAEREKIGRNAQ